MRNFHGDVRSPPIVATPQLKETGHRRAEALSGRLSNQTRCPICEYPAVQVAQAIQSNANPAIHPMVSRIHRKVRSYPELCTTAATLTTLVQKQLRLDEAFIELCKPCCMVVRGASKEFSDSTSRR